MSIPFYKYQGTGNDFIIIDNRDKKISILPQATIAQWCDRKFGIGADGLMLLEEKEGYDFEMIYYNSDGKTSSMCGNGGRCITAFANFLGILNSPRAHFLAIDGPHDAIVTSSDYIELKMIDVTADSYNEKNPFLNTGSPHHIEFVEQLASVDIYSAGKTIRYNEQYKAEGTNVNFIEPLTQQAIKVGTYERGVENETLSCGTGVTAAAIAYHLKQHTSKSANNIDIQTKGGNLQVRFQQNNMLFHDIWLCGPAIQVFNGTIHL